MDKLSRRKALGLLAGAAVAGCRVPDARENPPPNALGHAAEGRRLAPLGSVPADAFLSVERLGAPPWPTRDPFLFCVHHVDRYPAGNERLGPAASLAGRMLGRDFAGQDGWNMYHGQDVPGFPRHPHRGFETITVVQEGLLDHSDSLGATARYGQGDVQWLTAGRGIQHAEMFPLVRSDGGNALRFFQIWLNLPASRKFAEPHFAMLWQPVIPRRTLFDREGKRTELTVVAGPFEALRAPNPPPESWAAEPRNEVAVWTLSMQAGARFVLPAASRGVERSLYIHRGVGVDVGGRAVAAQHLVALRADVAVELVAGSVETEILLLQGRPIGEPVARHGPFVMNTRAEIEQAYADFRRTQFGGWPWSSGEPVHPRREGRFALRPNGELERAPG